MVPLCWWLVVRGRPWVVTVGGLSWSVGRAAEGIVGTPFGPHVQQCPFTALLGLGRAQGSALAAQSTAQSGYLLPHLSPHSTVPLPRGTPRSSACRLPEGTEDTWVRSMAEDSFFTTVRHWGRAFAIRQWLSGFTS